GQMWWEADIDGPLGFSDERDGSTLFYGVGVALKLLPNLNVRAEYERAELDDDDVDADVDFASIGAEFIF
ncbi:MAG: outer membrane beta-barrel protein, partial [Pseudomonadota bacterium]|nr:outer membrane beta-barrel protein [Pseudomonadota bacterium]